MNQRTDGRNPFTGALRAVVLVAVLGAVPGQSLAVDTGAVGNGDWTSTATWTNGVPGAADNAYIGSAYPNGAAAAATVTLSQNTSAGTVYLGNGSGTSGTLDLGGHNLSADFVYVGENGGSGAIQRTGGGALALNSAGLDGVYFYGGSFSFAPTDVTSRLTLYNGASATTTVVGNVTTQVAVTAGCTLTLGADLILKDFNPPPGRAGSLDLAGNLNCNGHAISAQDINLDFGAPYTFANRGPITAQTLVLAYNPGQPTFSLMAADSVGILQLNGVNTILPAGSNIGTLGLYTSNGTTTGIPSAATTSGANNITSQATISLGCALTLGADLIMGVSGQIQIDGTVNANGHAISAASVDLTNSVGPAILQNDGLVTVAGRWAQSNGTNVLLHYPGDALGTLLLSGNSALTITDAAGQTSGLTVAGQTASSISIDSTSDLILDINGLASGWVFRWADPNIADLQALINAGEVTLSYSDGGSYNITTDGSYSYVNVIPVPEPGTLGLVAVGLLGVWRCRRRCR